MSGVVGRYMGAALGQSLQDVGGMLYRGQQQDDERERDRLFRAEQAELTRKSHEETASLNREAKEKPNLSDDQINELAAGKLGMSVPEVTAHRNAVRTGDDSDFKLDEYPEGITPEMIQAKRQALYELLEQYQTGKEYEPIEKGRSESHTRGLVDRAIDEPNQAPAIAQGVAAGQGKGAFGGNSDVVRNEFTGAVKTTDIGRARADNLRSDSKLDLANIDALEKKGTLTKEDSVTLTTVVEKANSTIKSLADNPPGRDQTAKAEWQKQMRDAQELRNRAMDLLSSKLAEKEAPAPRKPLAAGGAKPKSDYKHLWNGT